MKLPEKLKKYRESRGFTQEQFAEVAGVSRQLISRMELGEITPSLNVARRIADVLNITIDELVRED